MIKQSNLPPEEIIKTHASGNKQVEIQKELFKGRNEEIEALIEEVLKKQGEKSVAVGGGNVPQDDQSLASLLRFLIQVVMQQTSDQA